MNGSHVVVRTIERAPRDVVDELAAMGAATVHEAIGRRGFAGAELRPIQQGADIAATVQRLDDLVEQPVPKRRTRTRARTNANVGVGNRPPGV